MTAFTAIDLSRVPPPDVVEVLDPAAIVDELKAAVVAAVPELAPKLTLASDPLVKVIEAFAWRELLLRNHVNNAVRAVNLATSTGHDLDNLAALMGVVRLVLDPGDEDASPAIPPTLETDGDLRRRVQLAPEGATAAGTVGSYTFHALAAHPDVADATATNLAPGMLTTIVTVLSRQGDGTPDPTTLAAIETAMEPFRPLGVTLTIAAPTVLSFAIDATLTFFTGPDATVIQAAAEERLTTYLTTHRRLGRDITRAGIFGSLMVEGVQNVGLTSPAADVVCAPTDVAHCTGVTITYGGRDD
ncbi:MAG: baseplate J/gp47 family protein [Pseudomonadota bacterium]